MADTATLLLIDVQKAFLDPEMGERNNPEAERQMARILQHWRQTNRPVIHVQHFSLNPESLLQEGKVGQEIQEMVRPLPDEPVLAKHVNSAFIGTDLAERLRHQDERQLVIVGLTTDHCVSTTTRMAANLGFVPFLVSDATATFARTLPDGTTYPAAEVHHVNLASLHGEFATVLSTASLLERFV